MTRLSFQDSDSMVIGPSGKRFATLFGSTCECPALCSYEPIPTDAKATGNDRRSGEHNGRHSPNGG